MLQNLHCLYISMSLDVFPENIGPTISSRYPVATSFDFAIGAAAIL